MFESHIIRSDNLKEIAEEFVDASEEPALGFSGRLVRRWYGRLPPRLTLVVDSQCVLRDLKFLVAERADPTASTAFQEIMGAGVVDALAPFELREQVERHLGDLAEQTGMPLAAFEEQWAQYQGLLHFVEATDRGGMQRIGSRDATDAPFVDLCLQTSADAIVTDDPDFAVADVPVLPSSALPLLRDYARAKAIASVGEGAIVGLIVFCKASSLIAREGVRGFRGLPTWVKVVVGVGTPIALLIFFSSQWGRGLTKRLIAKLREMWREISPELIAFVRDQPRARRQAQKLWKATMAEIRTPLPYPPGSPYRK